MTPATINIADLITPITNLVTSNWAALAGLFGFFFGVKYLPRLVKRFSRG